MPKSFDESEENKPHELLDHSQEVAMLLTAREINSISAHFCRTAKATTKYTFDENGNSILKVEWLKSWAPHPKQFFDGPVTNEDGRKFFIAVMKAAIKIMGGE